MGAKDRGGEGGLITWIVIVVAYFFIGGMAGTLAEVLGEDSSLCAVTALLWPIMLPLMLGSLLGEKLFK